MRNKKTFGRKKGNVILLCLMVIIMVFILATILLNITMSFETSRRALHVAEQVGKMRAQAVDIYLKEATGKIEIIHPVAGYNENVDHDKVAESSIGMTRVLSPTDFQYQQNLRKADAVAKQAGLDYLAVLSGTTANGDKLIDMNAGDMCFQVKAIPGAGGSAPDYTANMQFSCDFANNTGTSVNSISVATTVSTQQSPSMSYHRTGDPASKKVQIQNVVFTGVRVKYNLFIYEAMAMLGLETGPHYITVWTVSYPQIDTCSSADPAFKCDLGG